MPTNITQLTQRVLALEGKVATIMSAKDEILNLCDQMNTALQAIAAKEANSITPADAQAIKDKLTQVVQAAQALAQ